jgi:hypothetical protein
MCNQMILAFLIGLGIGSPVGWILFSLAMIRRDR